MGKLYLLRLMPLLSIVLIISLLVPIFVRANARALPQQQDDKKKKEDKKKEEDNKKKDDSEDKEDKAEKASKSELKYQKFLTSGNARYNNDEYFRDDVDFGYQELQRDQAEYAYLINVSDTDDKLIVRNGDKITTQDTLYDNALAQDYLNRLGQSLVPKESDKLYAFRITLNPLIEARSMSTGTVYISTGLLARIENEAQLAFILGHEIGHVEREHWKQDVIVAKEIERYNRRQEKTRAGITMAAGIGGALLGGFGGKSIGSAIQGGLAVAWMTSVVTKLTIRNSNVTWDKYQDEECDQLALRYMLNRNYDVQQAPAVYGLLREAARKEKRTQNSFIAGISRLNNRINYINDLLADKVQAPLISADPKSFSAEKEANKRMNKVGATLKGAMSADIQQKLDAGELIASTAEFSEVMAQVCRDNGVQAFYFDMFQMAKDNLSDAINIRSSDPYAHYFLGRVLKQTARTPAQRLEAQNYFSKAIELDVRRSIPEPHLYKALTIIESKDKNQWGEAVNNLKNYVKVYQINRGGALPPNMEVIYSFMQEAGERNWLAVPVMNSKETGAITENAAVAIPAPTPVSPTVPPKRKP